MITGSKNQTARKPKRNRRRKRRKNDELMADLPPLSKFARERRERLGYTQEELAFRSGLNTRFIKEFELGKRTARLDKVNQLVEFLGGELKAEMRQPL